MAKMLIADYFVRALVDAGVFTEDEYNHTRRVVIDAHVGQLPIIYVERFGDDRMLKVAQTLNGVEVELVEADTSRADPERLDLKPTED